MIQDVQVPSVGESISEGVLAKWNVADGQYVEKGDALFDLETDKATSEVYAPAAGTIQLLAGDGDEVRVGAVVARIDTAGKATGAKPAKAKAEPKPKADAPAKKAAAAPAAPPPAPPVAPKEPAAPATDSDRVRISGVARKMAEQAGIDPAAIKGTGPHGRISSEDVEAHLAQRAKPAAAPVAESAQPESTRERMSLLRRRIAERMLEATQATAMLTTFNDVDMSAVLEMRKRYKEPFQERHGVGLGFMSFFVRATVVALRDFPRINSMIDGNDIVTFHKQHVGVAVSTDRGLVVPVLRDAARLSFADIERTIRDYATKAREGRIEVADMQGGTFTITNGGVFGSLLSTPILNPPQSAILGMHRIDERPVARDGQVVVRPMMYVALSYDHRIVDGREAVGFLVRIKQLIEDPARLALDV
ncbi:MAG: 2-oxoglutarate dehydrogenase complex dihydrolipoyllysine-residue succinyltransferase [Candidatus Sumerlaeia bacterium]|nr:2-oxoglutarate dehydrogenase complex dihydrolipoyllysine-residue succinyltransferase [Candidatus Sumerlaeia bacterium]